LSGLSGATLGGGGRNSSADFVDGLGHIQSCEVALTLNPVLLSTQDAICEMWASGKYTMLSSGFLARQQTRSLRLAATPITVNS